MTEPGLSLEVMTQIRDRVQACCTWYHSFEIVPGIMTPGSRDCAVLLAYLDRAGLPAAAKGLRVADIGCRDGFFSFEMERRGAEVTAIDRSPLGQNGFELTRELRGSALVHHVDNVYYLEAKRYGLFDIVLMLGLLYHLRNPLMALDRLRGILKTGGLIFVETLLLTQATWAPAQPGQESAPVPEGGLMQILPERYKWDGSNVWAPTMTGLKMMLERAQFEVLQEIVMGERGLVCARAVENSARARYQREDYETHVYA